MVKCILETNGNPSNRFSVSYTPFFEIQPMGTDDCDGRFNKNLFLKKNHCPVSVIPHNMNTAAKRHD